MSARPGDAETGAASGRPARRAAICAIVGSAACWGLATVMSKGVLESLPPFTLLAIQLAASTAFLWTAAGIMRARFSLGPHGLAVAATGVLEPGLAYGVGILGLARTSAGDASMIGAAEPAFICALAWLAGERLARGLPAAMGVAVAGVACITLAGTGGPGGGDLAGNALVLLGTLFAAFYVVASRRLVAHVAPLPLAALQQSAGLGFVLLLLAAAVAGGFEQLPARMTMPVLALAALTGIVQYAAAVWLYLFGMTRLPANVAGLFLALIPVFGVAGAMAVLGERPSLLQGAGGLLVMAAVARIARAA